MVNMSALTLLPDGNSESLAATAVAELRRCPRLQSPFFRHCGAQQTGAVDHVAMPQVTTLANYKSVITNTGAPSDRGHPGQDLSQPGAWPGSPPGRSRSF